MPIPEPSTPLKGYMMNGKPYVFTDTKGGVAPAMRDPVTNQWVPDPAAMARGGMKQLGSGVAAPEDDVALKTAAARVDPARELSGYAERFEGLRGKLNARGVQTGPQWLPAPVAGKSGTAAVRRSLAKSDPESEGLLEQMEGLSGTMWPLLRPEHSGAIRTSESGGTNADAVVSMPDPGWKTAVPNIGAVGPADAGMATGFRDQYVDASNRSDYLQNYVHSGKGSAAAGGAAFENLKQTPHARAQLASGKHVALGAEPGDFSGKVPGWSAGLTPQQKATVKLLAPTAQQFPPGHYNNPFTPANAAEAAQLYASHPGAYVVNFDGRRIAIPK